MLCLGCDRQSSAGREGGPMQGVKRWGGAAIAASCAVALAGTPVYADTGDRYGGRDPIQVGAEGLNGPFEISAEH